MRGMGDAVGRDVDLTPENCPGAFILRYIVAAAHFQVGIWFKCSLPRQGSTGEAGRAQGGGDD